MHTAAGPVLTEAHSSSISDNSSHPSQGSPAGVIHPTVVHRQSHTALSSTPSNDGTIHPTVVHRQSALVPHSTSSSLSTSSATLPTSIHHTAPSVQPLTLPLHTRPPQPPPAAETSDMSAASAHDSAATEPKDSHTLSHHLWHKAASAVPDTARTQRTGRRTGRRKAAGDSADDDDVELTCLDLVESLFFCCAPSKPETRVAVQAAPAQSKMQS